MDLVPSFPATWATMDNFMNKDVAVGTKFIAALRTFVSSNRAYSVRDDVWRYGG